MHAEPIAFLATTPATVVANLVWPALYLVQGILTWWVILIGLAIEIVALRLVVVPSFARAARIGAAANVISTLLGVVLIPIVGLVYEVFPGHFVNAIFDYGTFNPIAWVSTFVLAVVVNVVLETWVMRNAFDLAMSRRHYLAIVASNVASAAVAIPVVFRLANTHGP